MPKVQYTDDDGYMYLVRVPDNAKPYQYSKGIFLGPPDLKEIGLPEEDEKKLRKELVESELVSAQTIRGSNQVLYRTVRRALPEHNTHDIVRWIKHLYQVEE